jgi:putative membrane protein
MKNSTMETKGDPLKYKNLIIIVSIAIPLVVAILFRIRLEGVQALSFLPPIYASINGYTAVVLLVAYWAIRNRKITLHEQLMKTAIALSLAFLLMYVAYHLTSDPTPFGGEGWVKSLYYFILVSHILLSIIIIPLVLISYVRAISKQFSNHRKIARITFPIWLYITITGVVIYLMISPYYT